MMILAFESSAKAASCALCRDGLLIAQTFQNSGLTHSSTLLPMAESLISNAGVSLADITLIAVARGPGSFTGIRIGVSAAKGLAWATGIPVTGISTLESMAWHGLCSPPGALICAVMDARRAQLYNAVFEISDGMPKRLCDDRAIDAGELAAWLEKTGRAVFLVGDGSGLFRGYLDGKLQVLTPPPPLIHQTAWGVAMAAAEAVPGSADELMPIYLRLSQAERERRERLKQTRPGISSNIKE